MRHTLSTFFLGISLLAAGCATETAPTGPTAVAEPPCSPGKLPQKPAVWPADNLTGDEDLWIMGTTLWADRKARMAYERQISAFAEECTKR